VKGFRELVVRSWFRKAEKQFYATSPGMTIFPRHAPILRPAPGHGLMPAVSSPKVRPQLMFALENHQSLC